MERLWGNCWACEYYDPGGLCRRRSPQAVPVYEQDDDGEWEWGDRGTWPTTAKMEWCGEFRESILPQTPLTGG